jgi:hypothetical protein
MRDLIVETGLTAVRTSAQAFEGSEGPLRAIRKRENLRGSAE